MKNAAPSKIDAQQVEDAWQAYAATHRAARERPALLANEYFLAIQDTAYARFLLTFEAMEVDPEAAARFLGGNAP